MIKEIIIKILPFLDILFMPFVYPAAALLKIIRRAGVQRLPFCKKALLNIGVFPIRNHYYEPQFNTLNQQIDFSKNRSLNGINWNVTNQLRRLNKFNFAHELMNLPHEKQEPIEFYMKNGAFESGDAEYWYQLIRTIKPKRIIEIGSGYSTLMAIKAIRKNQSDNPSYTCDHICIDPYEKTWLENFGITVIREKVEDLELDFFSILNKNDILFIDSSHVIRPNGDVLFEYLELLPSINIGVIVHVHDIFSPKNYPKKWIQHEVKFWNEQYLLEAFLTNNSNWEILGAVNFLHHNHYEALKSIAPHLSPDKEPGSFYIQKIA